jgi:hypothetical protein
MCTWISFFRAEPRMSHQYPACVPK